MGISWRPPSQEGGRSLVGDPQAVFAVVDSSGNVAVKFIRMGLW